MSHPSSSTNVPLLNKKRKSADTSQMTITIKKVKLSVGIESYIHIEDVKIPMNEEKNSSKLKRLISLLSDYYEAVKEDYKLNSKVESKLEISRKKRDKSIKKQKRKSSKPYENSDKKLNEVINYYQENIPEIKMSDINQPFKSHITSTSFYMLAFYLIKENYLSTDIRSKLTSKIHKKLFADPRTQYLETKKQIKKICDFFSLLKQYDFQKIEEKEEDIKSFYSDIILSCFLNYKCIQDRLYTLVLNDIEITKLEKTSLFHKYNNSKYKNLTYDDLKTIATSNVALNAFYIISKKQGLFDISPNIKKKEIPIILNKIKDEVMTILNEYQFYIGNIDTFDSITWAITSVNKMLILNKQLICPNFIMTNEQKLEKNALILIVILHEICHSLIRLKKNNNNNNYINNTIEFKEDNSNCLDSLQNEQEIPYEPKEESGEYFEQLVTGNVPFYPHKIAKFINNINNWSMKLEDFNREILTLFNDFRNDGPSCQNKPSSKVKIDCGKIYAIQALPFITDYFQRMSFLRLYSSYLYNTITEKYLK